MPTEYITAAWQKLTAAGWKLKRADHDLIEVTNPGGYTSTMRVRRIPSLARYVHLEPLEAPLTTELARAHQYYCQDPSQAILEGVRILVRPQSSMAG